MFAGNQIAGDRPYQEDWFRCVAFRVRDADGCDVLMVLADGMGGHRGGAEASRLAVSAVVDTFRATTGGVAPRLRASLNAANAAVGGYAAEHPDFTGMGCTLVVCAVTDDEEAHWISVGDSPLWCLRTGAANSIGNMERLNADHSMRPVLENMVRLGRMSAEEARKEGTAQQLRSAVTGDDLRLVDEGAAPIRLYTGDWVVLASDGLETLTVDEICRLCGGVRTADAAVGNLLQAVVARAKPSQDNATVIVYRHGKAATVRRRFERLTAPTRPLSSEK